ncbi:MAG: hypothetical protein L0196_08905 [candidate division Zixibacteria bacterium]|nr:hypothetical protein [candidate division Zixibacteria bacterium]
MILPLAVSFGCGKNEPSPATHASSESEPTFGAPENWATVFFHADLTVALDTTRIEPMSDGSYLLWFQKMWVTPRKVESQPFNRELICALVRCEPLGFKTVSLTLFHDDGPPLAQKRAPVIEAVKEEWKTPAPGSADEGSFQQACINLPRLAIAKK